MAEEYCDGAVASFRVYPKVNAYLKVTGFYNTFHGIQSRVLLAVGDMYDTLEFSFSGVRGGFLRSVFADGSPFLCESNLIDKVYYALCRSFPDSNLGSIKIKLVKRIPVCGGLGGGSSDAAVALLAMNRLCNLGLKYDSLLRLALEVGSDVAFFLCVYTQWGRFDIVDHFDDNFVLSANVSGRGEVVCPFLESVQLVRIHVVDVSSETKAVYEAFDLLLKDGVVSLYKYDMSHSKSRDLLLAHSVEFLNDLYLPAVALCPRISEFYRELSSVYKQVFFSGSGSSFFSLM